jgi:hypothetical protein
VKKDKETDLGLGRWHGSLLRLVFLHRDRFFLRSRGRHDFFLDIVLLDSLGAFERLEFIILDELECGRGLAGGRWESIHSLRCRSRLVLFGFGFDILGIQEGLCDLQQS